MRRIFLLMSVMLLALTQTFAEKKVGEYTNAYWNGKAFDIEAALSESRGLTIFIGVESKDDTNAFISVTEKNIQSFITFLRSMKDKFVEWKGVAEANHVTSLEKPMDFTAPPLKIHYFYGSEWRLSYLYKMRPYCRILDDGTMIVGKIVKAPASDNHFITETIYFVFENPADIDGLIQAIDPVKIRAILTKEEQQQDLFH